MRPSRPSTLWSPPSGGAGVQWQALLNLYYDVFPLLDLPGSYGASRFWQMWLSIAETYPWMHNRLDRSCYTLIRSRS